MTQPKPILYIFAGLPGAGKSTIACLLAHHLNCVYLCIDTIEQGLRDLCDCDVEGEGYRLAYRIASDNLRLNRNVIADSCNPIILTRNEWQQVALDSDASYINIEITCSDATEHQSRVATRLSQIKGLTLPNWEAVRNREYHSWESERITIDTANIDPHESLSRLLTKMKSMSI